MLGGRLTTYRDTLVLGLRATWLRLAPGGGRSSAASESKIVGLLAGKNEGHRIAFGLGALSRVCDAVVYLDDHSDDDSVSVVRAIAAECRVARIVEKTTDEYRESIRRTLALQAGRDLGGSHFVVIDADEAFTANCVEGDFLRRRILALRPGETLELAWIQLWRSMKQYRHDRSVWTHNYKQVAFADDGQCAYDDQFIHLGRVPTGLRGRRYRIPGYTYGLMHFQFVDWDDVRVKQAWYRCLERLHDPTRPGTEINAQYAASTDERGLGVRAVPAGWFDGYRGLPLAAPVRSHPWRRQQVRAWFARYGAGYFGDLDIWDIDWNSDAADGEQRDRRPAVGDSR